MTTTILLLTLILPLITSLILLLFHPPQNRALQLNCLIHFFVLCSSIYFFQLVRTETQLLFFENWIRLDALSTFYFLIISISSFLIALYSQIYFSKEALPESSVLRFIMLWSFTTSMGVLVLISNNIALMWVALEATTVFSAFLICAQKSKASLEAMWKYLILCTIGVAFAFIGTLLIQVSAQNLNVPIHDILLWNTLNEYAPLLDIKFVKAGFIFLLVGYGTKAGLAPMHTWMPDVYSSAPAPFGALSSGVLINLAVYALIRFIPIAEKATAYSGWAHHLLLGMGCLTLVIATAFILFQKNIKRLLAYSSIEHIGIIALAMGLPGIGVWAGLLHSFNHALAKIFAFFCAGRLRQIYGTHDMNNFSSTMHICPLWSSGLLLALLTLIGAAPFAIFLSKFKILQALVGSQTWFALAILILASSLIFITILKYVMMMSWKKLDSHLPKEPTSFLEKIIVASFFIFLITLCLWIPSALRENIDQASQIIMGVRL